MALADSSKFSPWPDAQGFGREHKAVCSRNREATVEQGHSPSHRATMNRVTSEILPPVMLSGAKRSRDIRHRKRHTSPSRPDPSASRGMQGKRKVPKTDALKTLAGWQRQGRRPWRWSYARESRHRQAALDAATHHVGRLCVRPGAGWPRGCFSAEHDYTSTRSPSGIGFDSPAG